MKFTLFREASKSVHILSLGFGALAVLAQGASLAVSYWLVKTGLGAGYLGVWALLQAVFVFVRVAEFGLSQSLIHFIPKAMAEKDTLLARSYFDTVLLSSTLLFLALAAAFYFPAYYLLQSVVESEYASDLERVFPLAVLALVILNIGQTGINALIGLQKAYQAHAIVILAFMVNVFVVVQTIDDEGLLSLAYGNLATGLILLLLGNFITSVHLKTAFLLPVYFRIRHLKSILSIGMSIQAISLLSSAADASIKFYINHYIGIQAVGIFEMANRFILFARGIFALPQNYLGSFFGNMVKDDKSKVSQLVVRSLRLSLNLAFVFVAMILTTRIWVGDVWVGDQSPMFQAFSLILIVGWFFNIFLSPIYYYLVGIGELRSPIIAQLLYCGGTLISCSILGATYTAYGLAACFSLSLAFSQIYLLIAGARVVKVDLKELIRTRMTALLILLATLAFLLSYVDSIILSDLGALRRFAGFALVGVVYLLIHINIDGSFIKYIRNR